MSLETEKYFLNTPKVDAAQFVLTEKTHLGYVNLENALLAFTGQAMAYDQALFDPDMQLALNENQALHHKGDPNLEEEKKEDKEKATDEEKKEGDVAKEAKEDQEAKDAQAAKEAQENAQEKKAEENQALDKPNDSENVNIDDVSVVSFLSPFMRFIFFLDEHLSEAFRVGYGMPILEQSVPRNLGIYNDFLGVIYHIFPVFPIEVPATGGPCCVNPISIEVSQTCSFFSDNRITQIENILNNSFKFTFEYFCDRNEGDIIVSQVGPGVRGSGSGGIRQYDTFTPETFIIKFITDSESCCPPLNCDNPIVSISFLIDSETFMIPCIDYFSSNYDSGAIIRFLDSGGHEWELVDDKKNFVLQCADEECGCSCEPVEVPINFNPNNDPVVSAAFSDITTNNLNAIFTFTYQYDCETEVASLEFTDRGNYSAEIGGDSSGGSIVQAFSVGVNIIQPDGNDLCEPLNCDNVLEELQINLVGENGVFDFNSIASFVGGGNVIENSEVIDSIFFRSTSGDIWSILAISGGDFPSYDLVCSELQGAPLVFDLNHNGIELSSVKDSSVKLNLDGIDKNVGWVGAGDGILTYDYSGEGHIENKNFILTDNVQGAQTDLQALQMLAGQKSGLLDMSNAIWDKLGMWQDGNQDGKMDKGEYHTLGDLKIASINLAGDGDVHYLKGNLIANNMTFNYEDGTVGKAADVILKTEDVVQAEQNIPGIGGNASSSPAVVAANDAAPVVAPVHVDPAVQSAIEVQQPVAVVA